MKLGAIIAAAGSGLRMKNSARKQYLLLEGVPVLAYSVRLFQNHPEPFQIAVVVPREDLVEAGVLLRQYCPSGGIELVGGGATRQGSVYIGLQALPRECEIICVHDAARPLASGELLLRLVEAAQAFGAAVPVIRPADTVKAVGVGDFIAGTPPRDRLRLVQTPQAFRAALIRQAYEKAAAGGVQATDDASLVEQLGEPVKAVAGEAANLKITEPPDMILASWYLRGAKF